MASASHQPLRRGIPPIVPEILIVDPLPSSPAYDCALLKNLRSLGIPAELWTADFHHLEKAKADAIPGRHYKFLLFSRWLRRRFKSNKALTLLARMIIFPEYFFNHFILFIYCLIHRPILHIEWILHPTIDLPWLFLHRLAGVKTIYTAHNVLPHDRETCANKILYGLVYRLMDRIIVHSENQRREFQEIFFASDKIRVIPHGLIFEDRSPVDRSVARKQFGWEADETIAVFHGAVLPYKGMNVLLSAITALRTKKKVRFILAADWKGNMNRYNHLLKKTQETHSIDIWNKMVTDDELIELACGADLWILPYTKASASFSGMAALRYGIPMIVTNTGALPEMAGQTLEPFIAKPGDIDSLRDSLERFLELNPNQLKKIREEIIQHSNRFNWRLIAQKTADVYREISTG